MGKYKYLYFSMILSAASSTALPDLTMSDDILRLNPEMEFMKVHNVVEVSGHNLQISQT
jgi:hypothetical protein